MSFSLLKGAPPPASDRVLDRFAATIAAPLPAALRALYRIADGQRPDAAPLFTAKRDGSRCHFLTVAAAEALWCTLSADPGVDDWAPHLVPFASDGGFSVLCVDLQTEAVRLLWTGGPDWTLPRGWQTGLFEEYPSLDALLAATSKETA